MCCITKAALRPIFARSCQCLLVFLLSVFVFVYISECDFKANSNKIEG